MSSPGALPPTPASQTQASSSSADPQTPQSATADPNSVQGQAQGQAGSSAPTVTFGSNPPTPLTTSTPVGTTTSRQAPIPDPPGFTGQRGAHANQQTATQGTPPVTRRPTPVPFSGFPSVSAQAGYSYSSQALYDMDNRMATIAREAVSQPFNSLMSRIEALQLAIQQNGIHPGYRQPQAPQSVTLTNQQQAAPVEAAPVDTSTNAFWRMLGWHQPSPVTRTNIPGPPQQEQPVPQVPPEAGSPNPVDPGGIRTMYQPGPHPVDLPVPDPDAISWDLRFPRINPPTLTHYTGIPPVPPPRAIESVVPISTAAYDNAARAAGHTPGREMSAYGRDALKEARALGGKLPKFRQLPTDSLYDPYLWMLSTDQRLRSFMTAYPTASTGLTETHILDLVIPECMGNQAQMWFRQLRLGDRAKSSFHEFWVAFANTFINRTLARNLMDELRSLRISKFSNLHQYTQTLDMYVRYLENLKPTMEDDEMYDIIRHHMDKDTFIKLSVDHKCVTYYDIRMHWWRQIQAEQSVKTSATLAGSINHISGSTLHGLPFLATVLSSHYGELSSLGMANHPTNSVNEISQEDYSVNAYVARDAPICADATTCVMCHMDPVETHSRMYCNTCDDLFLDPNPEEAMDELRAIGRSRFNNISPITSKCSHCGAQGHFVRDCPKLGGSGKSVVGQRYGTATGFKEGDDPKLRPQHYRDAVARRQKAYMAQRKGKQPMKAQSSQSKGSTSGKMATHARRLRTGAATKPPTQAYLKHLCHNIMIEDCEDTDISQYDEWYNSTTVPDESLEDPSGYAESVNLINSLTL